MFWLLFAFSGPVFWAASLHIDKYLVEKYFRHASVTVLMVFTALIGLVTLPFIWLFVPGVFAYSLSNILVMTALGVVYMYAMILYLMALQSAEASVIAPFFQVSPIFAFALAYVFLGETLTQPQFIGGLLIMAGMFVLSFQKTNIKKNHVFRMASLMIAAAFLLSFSSVAFKYFAIHEEYWVTTFWTFVGEALFGVGILFVPKYRKQFLALLKQNTAAVLQVNGANELINLGAGLGVRYASLFAPIAIVQAISSTTTLFVFFFGVLLTLFFPKFGREDMSRSNLMKKGIAAVFVAIGSYLAGGFS